MWWAELADPQESGPGFRRPVLVVQADSFNRSRIATLIVIAITSNLALAEAPGNVLLSRRESKLPRESVINVSQVLTLDRRYLTEKVGRLPAKVMDVVESGLHLVLGLKMCSG